MRIIIIGAGIVGCTLAFRLSQAGHQVTVLDAAQRPATAATGASFGWINASFFADDAHFRLRAAGLAAWRELGQELGASVLNWNGALWWEAQGEALDRMREQLAGLGYAVKKLGGSDLHAMEPALVSPPENALLFAAEGCAEPAETAEKALAAAQSMGAQALFGLRVHSVGDGFVDTEYGRLEADQIIIAAGTGTASLTEQTDAPVPMLQRPGVLVKTTPLPPLLSHILVTPEGEIRQDSACRIVMPAAVAHQGDDSETVSGIHRQADLALKRLRNLLVLPGDIAWSEARCANRPVPGDGLPVVGCISDGAYVAVMHSGVTLAAVIADLVTAELSGRAHNQQELLAPYHPQRFSQPG